MQALPTPGISQPGKPGAIRSEAFLQELFGFFDHAAFEHPPAAVFDAQMKFRAPQVDADHFHAVSRLTVLAA